MSNEATVVKTSKTKSNFDKTAKVAKNYSHPGKRDTAIKEIYEDVDQYFECPECGGNVDNYSWHCFTCRKGFTIYKENGKCDVPASKVLRDSLVRINGWTGEKWVD